VERQRTPRGPATVLTVTRGADGVWTVSERGVNKAAMTYFPDKRSAVRHAVRTAKTKRDCEVRIVDQEGNVQTSRRYGER
jgi:hypothetical protein